MFKPPSGSGGGDGGVLTVGTFGSSPNSAGASISGTVLTLQPASATQPGGVTTGAQTFAGAKTYSSVLASTVASGSNFLTALDGARLNLSTADASAYLYRSAANTIRTPGALTVDGAFTGLTATFSGLLSSTVASGSNFLKALDGARLNLSTADTNAYLYRSTTDTIRTPGTVVIDGMLGIGVAPPVFPLHVVGSAASSLIAGIVAATDATSTAYMGVGNSASKGLAMYAVGTSAPAIQGTSVPYRDYGVLRSSATANGLVLLNGNATGTIKFAGTSGVNADAVPFAEFTSGGDFAVDTNVLLVDAANNRVGINKTVPTVPLDVVGAGAITGNLSSAVASGSAAYTFLLGARLDGGASSAANMLWMSSSSTWRTDATLRGGNIQSGGNNFSGTSDAVLNYTGVISNGASAVVHAFASTNSMTTVGTKLLSFRNVATEKAFIGKNGQIGFPTGNADSVVGTATLVGGTVTVNTTAVSATSLIFLTRNTPGGVTGSLSAPVASITAATSFIINSDVGTDTSTVNWWVINH